VATLINRLQPREISIERDSHRNRFQSQWLISAYERIIPSLPQRSPSLTFPDHLIGETTGKVNNMKEQI
jgi:hypothetical protein